MNDLLVQAHELHRRILEAPQRKLEIIQSFCEEKSREGDHESAELILIILNIIMTNPPTPSRDPLPSWFLPVGLGLILVFLMGIVIASMFGWVVPPEGKFALVSILAIGCGLSAGALGGKAAISGKLPFFKESPLAISATSGIAVLIIVFVIGYNYYIKLPSTSSTKNGIPENTPTPSATQTPLPTPTSPQPSNRNKQRNR